MQSDKLCCILNPFYYCGECNLQECKVCWLGSVGAGHFKFEYEGSLKIYCRRLDKELIEGKTFEYYGE